MGISARGRTIAEFARESGIHNRSLRDYIHARAKPGRDQLARMHASGIDIVGVMTGRISFPGDPTLSIQWPRPRPTGDLWEGIAVLGMMFVLEYQEILRRRIFALGDAFVARHHAATGEALSCSECEGVKMAYWLHAVDGLSEIATVGFEPKLFAHLSMDDVAHLVLSSARDASVYKMIRPDRSAETPAR